MTRQTILVLSGKGGVGKSTFAANLARALARGDGTTRAHVGVLDIDICGPSIPTIFGVRGKRVHTSDRGWIPVRVPDEESLSVMSLGFLVEDQDAAVVWRGPKKTSLIQQFVKDVFWGEIDFLVVDTPPGTSDEHLAAVESLEAVAGAVIVTQPQAVSVADVRRELTFCRKLNIPVIGIVENFSGFSCGKCGHHVDIFGSGGGSALAKECGVDLLGRVPVDPRMAKSGDDGTAPTGEAANALQEIAHRVKTYCDSAVPVTPGGNV